MFDDPKQDEALALLQEARQLLLFYEKHRAKLEAKGVDVNKVLAEAHSDLAALERACREVEESQDNLLQKVANLADAEYEAFKLNSALVDDLLKQKPFDPQVQELARLRDEEKKKFPKE